MLLIFNSAFSAVKSFALKQLANMRRYEKTIKIGLFSFIAIISVFMSFAFVGATLALRVSYNGKIIATIRDRSQFEAATVKVAAALNSSHAELSEVVKQPVFTSVLALDSELNSGNDIAQAIIDNTADIVTAQALYIDGEAAAYTADEALSAELERCRKRFETSAEGCTSEFMQSVYVEAGYHLSSDLKTMAELIPIIEAVPVKTVLLAAVDTEIPFTTENRDNASLYVGVTKTVRAGKVGIKRTGEQITFINGAETERVVLNEEVISEPVNKVVEVGTKRYVASGTRGSQKTASGFTFPLPSGVWQVSAYFGDGRGHRAVDLRAPSGTPIYAAATGTVVKAGWDGDYGYAILIDHGNGVQTRYAHESSIYVSVGQVVSAGQEIGAVGKTGNASGNHLHFEILINGTRIDPAPSLGLS